MKCNDSIRAFGLRTAEDLCQKLRPDYETLRRQVTSDAVFNFVVTAHHLLTDWIDKDPSVDQAMKDKLRAKAQNSEALQMIRDLADGAKHFQIDRSMDMRLVESTSASSGFGIGRFGKGSYGTAEESAIFTRNNGEPMNILELAKTIMVLCDEFFPAGAAPNSE